MVRAVPCELGDNYVSVIAAIAVIVIVTAIVIYVVKGPDIGGDEDGPSPPHGPYTGGDGGSLGGV